MSLKDELIEIIDSLAKDADKMLRQLESHGGLNLDRKMILLDYFQMVFSALADAKHSLEQDEDNYYFLKPFTVALLTCGQVYGEMNNGKLTSKLMSDYARLRLANDPKQKEKSFVKECWESWQENPEQYKSQAAFARSMLGKCEYLTSQKRIEDWCREWRNSHPAS